MWKAIFVSTVCVCLQIAVASDYESKSSYNMYRKSYWDWINSQNKTEFHLKHAKEMGKWMSTRNKEPCQDFMLYACSSFNLPQDSGLEGFISNEKYLEEMRNYIIHKLLTEPISRADSRPDVKVKETYSFCVNETDFKLPGSMHESFLYNIERLGISLKNMSNAYDWIKLSANIARYNISTFFRVVVGDVLRLEPTLLELSTKPSKSYKQQMTSWLESFEIEGSVLSRMISQLLRVDQKIDKFLIEANLNSQKDIQEAEAVRKTVGEWKTELPDFAINKFLGVFYSRVVPDTEEIEIVAPDYFKKLTEYLSKTSSKNIHHCLFTRLALHLKNTISQSDYESEPAMDETDLCISYVTNKMPTAIASLWRKRFFGTTERQHVKRIVIDIQKAFYEMLADSSWFESHTLMEAKKKISVVRKEIGYPFHVLIDSLVDKEYDNFKADFAEGDPVYRMLHRNFTQMRDDMGKSGDIIDTIWHGHILDVKVSINASKGGVLEVPLGVLLPPVYNRHFPKFALYAALGSRIGDVLVQLFKSPGVSLDFTGNKSVWWRENPEATTSQTNACSQYQLQIASEEEGLVNKVAHAPENLGLQIAFNAYKKFRGESTKSQNPSYVHSSELPPYLRLGLNEDQLFFLAYAQSFCHAGIDSPTPTVDFNQINEDLLKMDDFRTAFQCSSYADAKPECS